jgi:hypothetical protein
VLRVNPGSLWQGLLGCIIVALIATALSIMLAIDLSAEREREAPLKTEGVTVSATVVEVTERGRGGDPLVVRVRLPDGRQTLVDLADREASNAGMEGGATLEVRVLPRDISINYPADRPDSTTGWVFNLAPPILIGLGALIVGSVLYREIRRRRPPSTPADQQPDALN